MIVADQNGKFLLWNPAAERMIGIGPQESLLKVRPALHGVFLPDKVTPCPAEQLPLARAIRGESTDACELFLRNRLVSDGIWVSINARPLKDDQGTLQGGVAVIRNITRYKQDEESLIKREEWIRSILDLAQDAFLGIDAAGVITLWNSRAESMFGWPRQEAIGRRLTDTIIPPQYRDAHDGGLQRFLSTGAGPLLNQRVEITALHRDGHEFPVEVAIGSPVRRNGTVAFHAFVRDISDEKRAREALAQQQVELERSNRDLEQFAYASSHDLQEPLRAVSGYCQLLQRRFQGKLEPKAEEYIAQAVDGAKRMQSLIEGLLAYSRVGRQGNPLVPTSSQRAFDQALVNLEAAIAECDARITHDPLPTVVADPTQMMQLFQNLIGNGIKYRGEQPPQIHVSAEQRETEWLFSVRDNGIGIEPRYKDRIFVIFQRLHTRTEYPGTGIGLAICKRIVERHSGRIWVESEPGQGSVFFFSLPFVEGGN